MVFILNVLLNWLITCALYGLITLCFGMIFEWRIATGIWLSSILIKFLFLAGSDKKSHEKKTEKGEDV